MTLAKSQIIEAVAKTNGFTRHKTSDTVETVLEIIKSIEVINTKALKMIRR